VLKLVRKNEQFQNWQNKAKNILKKMEKKEKKKQEAEVEITHVDLGQKRKERENQELFSEDSQD